MEQINVFEILYEPFKIKTPIRLIECFAGIGSQAKALKRIGADFEHYKVVEFDKYAIKSYNAVHETDFETSDITKVHASDLSINETDSFTYILTYSFPCQDLSKAGKQKGMEKGSGTRSGLLWEVERILDESNGNLPQVLLMENVPDVIGANNIEHFHEWQRKLESLGYKNYCQVLNAKNYGIPQNRNRCFMISILGDYYYEFPKPFELKLRLKDMLEDEVDEKYYLSEKLLKCFTDMADRNGFVRGDRFKPHDLDSGCAYTITTSVGNRATDNFIKIPEATRKGYAEAYPGDGVYINRPHQKRGVVQKGMIQTLKTSCNDVGVVIGSTQKNAYKGSLDGVCPTLTQAMGAGGGQIPMVASERIRKFTPLECWRLMGFDDEDFYKAEKVNSNTQLYKQAGNSIVVNVLEAIFKQLF